MKLRPHNLLCIQLFTGHGYDEAFTANMIMAVRQLQQHPQTEILLHCGCDALCAVCPHNQNGTCSVTEKTDRLDAAVLRECGLHEGQSAAWQSLAAAARGQILRTDRFAAVCSSCQWYALCRETVGKEEYYANNANQKTRDPND